MVKKFLRKERGKKGMNPVVAAVAGKVVGRLLDFKKPVGLTNLTTAGGTGIIYLGYTLIQQDIPKMEWTGYFLVLVGSAVCIIKEARS